VTAHHALCVMSDHPAGRQHGHRPHEHNATVTLGDVEAIVLDARRLTVNTLGLRSDVNSGAAPFRSSSRS
jgi:hypothetical protein